MNREQAIKELISNIPIGRSQMDRYIEHLIQIINHDPTLEEVKKEWEDDGWKWEEDVDVFTITKEDIEIIIFKSVKQYYINCNSIFKFGFVNIQLHQRLTKTFRALGWEV